MEEEEEVEEEGRLRPSLAPIRLSMPLLLVLPLGPKAARAGLPRIGPLPPRVGVALFGFFFFPPKLIVAAVVAVVEWPDMGVDGADDQPAPVPAAAGVAAVAAAAGKRCVRELAVLNVPDVDTLRSVAIGDAIPALRMGERMEAEGAISDADADADAAGGGGGRGPVPFSFSSNAPESEGRLKCCCCGVAATAQSLSYVTDASSSSSPPPKTRRELRSCRC